MKSRLKWLTWMRLTNSLFRRIQQIQAYVEDHRRTQKSRKELSSAETMLCMCPPSFITAQKLIYEIILRPSVTASRCPQNRCWSEPNRSWVRINAASGSIDSPRVPLSEITELKQQQTVSHHSGSVYLLSSLKDLRTRRTDHLIYTNPPS